MYAFSSCLTCPHPCGCFSLDHFPDKVLALEFLPWGLLLGEANQEDTLLPHLAHPQTSSERQEDWKRLVQEPGLGARATSGLWFPPSTVARTSLALRMGQGPESVGAEPTYRNDLRTFHLPWTQMKESEMDKPRPWPGRGVKAEPSSSQLRMFRLGRETQRVAASDLASTGLLLSPLNILPVGTGPAGLL